MRLTRHKIFCALLLAFLLNLIVECLSRHSVLRGFQFLFQSPLPFLYGMAVVLLTVSLAGLFRRRAFTLLLVCTMWLSLGIVQCVIKSFRVTPLTAVDFQLIFSMFSIVDIYLTPLEFALICLAVVALVALLVLAFWKLPKAPPVDYLRAGSGCIAAGLLVWGATALFTGTGVLPTQFENLSNAYDDYGFAYCFCTSIFDRGIRQPEDYSPEEVDTVVEDLDLPDAEPAVSEAVQPNIVVVQLESFFDATYLDGVTYSEDPIPEFRQLKETSSSGFLTVPSIGAGTANSEFEVISGMSLDYFGTGEYPYETVLRSNVCESVNYALKQLDYDCHAIHNHTATFYGRNKVYANLGFDTFTPIEYMEYVERNPLGWAKDKILTGEILKAMNATEGQDLVYAISVQAHGKYPTETIDPDQPITVSGVPEGVDPVAFAYYINQLHETDTFVGQLVDVLRQRDEPTVLVLFGDHLPNFSITEDMLTDGNLLQTEYVIWSNTGLPKEDRDLYAYQLMAEVLDRLEIHIGVLLQLHQEREENPSYQQDLEILEYDILYGNHYAYEGDLPYQPTNLQMGVEPITVQRADNFRDEVYVTGRNFTDSSQVMINGTPAADTIRINANTLLLPATTLEPLDVVAVAQVTIDGEVLGQSNQYTYIGE